MTINRYNKATAAVIAGAAATLAGAVLGIDGSAIGALQTLLTAFLVWLAPNEA